MARTRYREERTLVRRLCRLPREEEERSEFNHKVLKLREQFKKFNLDASETCQWLMGIRPDGKRANERTKLFWDFFLEPEKFLKEEDKDKSDRCRRVVFDFVAGFEKDTALSEFSFSKELMDSIQAIKSMPRIPCAEKLFQRLVQLNPAHRQVLLKASSEWIFAHYQKAKDNWEFQHKHWEEEKKGWENRYPDLTDEIRKEFTEIFKQMDIREKRPRICPWERLKESKDNCLYAGEKIGKKNHAQLCKKYKDFLDDCKRNNVKKFFAENAEKYLSLKRNQPYLPKEIIIKEFLNKNPKAKWFTDAWDKYLKAMGITEQTILSRGSLPHCVEFGDDKECQFNQHTEKCRQYKALLDAKPELQALEGLYRKWREKYLSGPSKPSFKYPSAKKLSMPKIFGAGFFEVDFNKSILKLRLDDMPEGKFLEFGFIPWPKDYKPQPNETEITSCQVNFIGTRPRVGFRFKTPHKKSRFTISQDEIDELRSRKYPRQEQDQKFLDEARKRLLESFPQDPKKELKILAVDLGEKTGGAVLFKGTDFQKYFPLKVVKMKKLLEIRPEDEKDKNDKISKEEKKELRKKGLGKWHIALHLEARREQAKAIAEKRQKEKEKAELRNFDLRKLTLHTRWMIRDWVRLNASQIIQLAEQNQVDLIVFESMRGFSVPGREEIGKEDKKLAFLAAGQIRRKVAEKAVERGMRIITVPYLESSKHCSICKKLQKDEKIWRKNKLDEHKFRCEKCKAEMNSEENAARVLARVFWGEITLPGQLPDHT